MQYFSQIFELVFDISKSRYGHCLFEASLEEIKYSSGRIVENIPLLCSSHWSNSIENLKLFSFLW